MDYIERNERVKNFFRGVALVALMALAGPLFAAEQAGKVILAAGAVSALGADGSARVLAKGSPVFPGDRITTASKSLCVLKMVDDAKLTLRADSEILIEEYTFNSGADDNSVLELVKGGFRSLTGAIGSNNPAAYKIKSDLSVLGIRGTDYDTRICEPGSCLQIGGDAPKYGQYTQVNSGGVYMLARCTSGSGNYKNGSCSTIDIAAGQAGFIGLDEVLILPIIPDFMSEDPTPSPADIPDSPLSLNRVESCQL